MGMQRRYWHVDAPIRPPTFVRKPTLFLNSRNMGAWFVTHEGGRDDQSGGPILQNLRMEAFDPGAFRNTFQGMMVSDIDAACLNMDTRLESATYN